MLVYARHVAAADGARFHGCIDGEQRGGGHGGVGMVELHLLDEADEGGIGNDCLWNGLELSLRREGLAFQIAAAEAAAADEYASAGDVSSVNEKKAALDAALAAAEALTQDATAQQRSDAAKAVGDAVRALADATDAANVNSAAARAAAEKSADQAGQLAAAKSTALDRLEDYSEAKALADATKAEKSAYDKTVADGRASINAAKDKAAVASALTGAKRGVDTALAKINAARAALAKAKSVTTVAVNTKTVTAKSVKRAIAKAGGSAKYVREIVLGKKVRKIKKGAFKSCKKAKTLVVKTKRLKKSTVRKSLTGSKVSEVKVSVGTMKTNKRYVSKYKKAFTKANAGRKAKVTL